MIRIIRTMTARLVLALSLLAYLQQPLRADDGTTAAPRPYSIDFERYLSTSGRPLADTTAAPPAAHGWSSYSGAKKTWIIVGIAAGVAAVAVAVSGSHGGGSGSSGGGGGY
jgi:hypothetical protein